MSTRKPLQKKRSTGASASSTKGGKPKQTRLKTNPNWKRDKNALQKLQDQAGVQMHKRVTIARRLYLSPQLRAEFATENGGKPLPDAQVLTLLEEKYFVDYKQLRWPLQTLFAILQSTPNEEDWGPDWPKLLAKVTVPAKAATGKTRKTVTVAQLEALLAEYEAYKEQMAVTIRRKDAEIATLRADNVKLEAKVVRLGRRISQFRQLAPA